MEHSIFIVLFSYGWDVRECDGHSYDELAASFQAMDQAENTGQPQVHSIESFLSLFLSLSSYTFDHALCSPHCVRC